MADAQQLELRPALNHDAEAVIDLIDRVYSEYGDRICLTGAESDLLNIESNYIARGGSFVLLEDAGNVIGTHATLPIDKVEGICTFRRLYVDSSWRGVGAGHRLMQWAIDWMRENKFTYVGFWSDTRFRRAHRFFGEFGFKKDGRIREMDDGHEPYREYYFSLNLDDE